MAELRLVSDHERQLKPLVEAALKNELRLLEAGINRTQQNMRKFEEKFHLSTLEFIGRYENDEMRKNGVASSLLTNGMTDLDQKVQDNVQVFTEHYANGENNSC